MAIDTVAVFHAVAGPVCAWSCAEGIVSTLSRMGYGVIDCARPPAKRVSLDLLRRADLVILCGPEHFAAWLEQEYGRDWDRLPAPKVAWYTESAYRDDRTFDFAGLKRFADLHYYPAIQDAEQFGGDWLPFGVDVELFRPEPAAAGCSAGFVGNLYPKRLQYIQSMRCAIDHIRPAQHPHARRSFEYLAQAYRHPDIFVNLPAYSRLLVTKVTEVMACGRMLVTPAPDHASGLRNLAQFEDGRHLVYYDPARPAELGELVEHYRRRPDLREAIAEAGCREVHRAHTLEARLRRILADAEFGKAAAPPLLAARDAQTRLASKRPDAQKRYRLQTAWGGFAYYDAASGVIGHAEPGVAQDNLVLCADNLRARLVGFRPGETAGLHLRFQRASRDWTPPGSTTGAVQSAPDEHAPDCDLEFVGADQALIRHGDNYLSADPDGVVRNDRNWGLQHETFVLVERA